jgi:hypothetical protein
MLKKILVCILCCIYASSYGESIKVFPIINTSAQRLSSLIKEVLSPSIESQILSAQLEFIQTGEIRKVTVPTVTYEPYTNQVIVRGSTEYLEDIQKLLDILDRQPELNHIQKIYHLKQSNPGDTFNLLTRIFPLGGAYYDRSVILVIPKDKENVVDELIEKLDGPDWKEKSILVIESLKERQPVEILELLRRIR